MDDQKKGKSKKILWIYEVERKYFIGPKLCIEKIYAEVTVKIL